MNTQKLLLKILYVLLLTALLLGVPRLAAMTADQFNYAAIDPDGAFAWRSVRHIVQGLIILLLMVIISRIRDIRFGFSWGNPRVGWFYVRVIALVYLGFIGVSILIMLLTRSFQGFPYPLNARNIIGHFGFLALLTGPSEELIFRAFAMTMLSLMITGVVVPGNTGFGKMILKIFGGEITVVNLIAAVIFGLAHVRFTFFPFSAEFILGQVIFSVFIGLFYGVCYKRSGSMIYPMFMHSIVNVGTVGASLIASVILG